MLNPLTALSRQSHALTVKYPNYVQSIVRGNLNTNGKNENTVTEVNEVFNNTFVVIITTIFIINFLTHDCHHYTYLRIVRQRNRIEVIMQENRFAICDDMISTEATMETLQLLGR